MSSTQLITLNYPVTLSYQRSTKVSLKTSLLFICALFLSILPGAQLFLFLTFFYRFIIFLKSKNDMSVFSGSRSRKVSLSVIICGGTLGKVCARSHISNVFQCLQRGWRLPIHENFLLRRRILPFHDEITATESRGRCPSCLRQRFMVWGYSIRNSVTNEQFNWVSHLEYDSCTSRKY